jgi:hypothetical protein
MSMFWRHLTTGVVAALAAFTWTASACASEMDQDRPSDGLPTVRPGSDGNTDELLMVQQGRRGFGVRGFTRFDNRFSSRSFNGFDSRFAPPRFNRFDNRFGFRRFDVAEDRLEAQLRRANPGLFRQFDRFEDRLEAQARFGRFPPR